MVISSTHVIQILVYHANTNVQTHTSSLKRTSSLSFSLSLSDAQIHTHTYRQQVQVLSASAASLTSWFTMTSVARSAGCGSWVALLRLSTTVGWAPAAHRTRWFCSLRLHFLHNFFASFITHAHSHMCSLSLALSSLFSCLSLTLSVSFFSLFSLARAHTCREQSTVTWLWCGSFILLWRDSCILKTCLTACEAGRFTSLNKSFYSCKRVMALTRV